MTNPCAMDKRRPRNMAIEKREERDRTLLVDC
jgi:hypothetical protein